MHLLRELVCTAARIVMNRQPRTLAFVVLGISTVGTRSSAQSPELWFDHPAASWSEALPIGNGRLAAMIFGGTDQEHLQLNEETIYAGKRMDRVNPEARAKAPIVRKLLLDGNVQEAEAITEKSLLAVPVRQPPYEPLGDLTITSNRSVSRARYRRSLDLFEG